MKHNVHMFKKKNTVTITLSKHIKDIRNVKYSIFWQILGSMRNRKISTDLNQIEIQCFLGPI